MGPVQQLAYDLSTKEPKSLRRLAHFTCKGDVCATSIKLCLRSLSNTLFSANKPQDSQVRKLHQTTLKNQVQSKASARRSPASISQRKQKPPCFFLCSQKGSCIVHLLQRLAGPSPGLGYTVPPTINTQGARRRGPYASPLKPDVLGSRMPQLGVRALTLRTQVRESRV